MFRWLKLILTLAALVYFANCSNVKFDNSASFNRCHNFTHSCVTRNGIDYFDYTLTIDHEKVDIIFIDDNSRSMYTEQTQMGRKFSNFIDGLQNLDYRIGIITTDVSATPNNGPSAYNRNGALQDGKLIPYPNGQLYITRDTPDKESLFLHTIKRQETLACESNPDTCPSYDERGIYAANLAVMRNADGMFRSSADHTAFVLLSDEDERSQGRDEWIVDNHDYGLQDLDQPQSLITNFKSRWPGKTMSFDAIIVRPNDSACLAAQNNQVEDVNGYYGKTYARLHEMTNNPTNYPLGNICASNYASLLNQIGTGIRRRALDSPLPCIPDDLQLTFEPAENAVSYQINTDTMEIEFASEIPVGTEVHHQFSCQSL